MKYTIDGVLVVEGSGDAAYLASFIDAEFVITNGLDLPAEKLSYLKAVSARKQVIVLTDPDDAGENIRRRIHEAVDCLDARVDVTKCNRKNKHGVAECEMSEIVESLKPFFVKTKNVSNLITTKDLFELGIENRQIYLFLEKKYKAYFSNKKQFLRSLNTLFSLSDKLSKAILSSLYHANYSSVSSAFRKSCAMILISSILIKVYIFS